mgnify:CR=1 FL=1
MANENDVLDVLHSNTNQQSNNFNEGKVDDEQLKVLNENKAATPTKPRKYENIKLSEEEEKARESASVDFSLGVQHADYDDIKVLKENERAQRAAELTPSEPQGDIEVEKQSTGEINTTKTLATDLVEQEENINPSLLYRDVLGNTAYSDLKRACGLEVNESFTDFYNRTHYVPKGYEVECKLLLAEEKRMQLYTKYAGGEMSKSDFLYQAYGKELMKEAGYDLTSKLYWYKKIKNGDRTNPLDNDTFLSELISNSEKLWVAEKWYQEKSTKKIKDTLSGLATGQQLSEEDFQTIFKDQVDALDEYFDNDIKKIMTYYQAGSLGSAFSPFIDIDGDGKYDYYYHSDGKLYAVDGSSGVGSSTCSLTYNEDGSVHSAQIHEAIDGGFDSFWEGFRNFWVGIVDIGALAVNGVSAIFGCNFVDKQQEYEAWKKRTIGDEDRVVFDSMDKYNGEDWGNSIANGVGTVIGMVVLALLTWGIGTAVSGAAEGINAGATAGTEAATTLIQNSVKTAAEEGAKTITKEAITQATNSIIQKSTEMASEKLAQQFINSGVQAFTKELAKQGIKTVGDTAVKTIAKEAASVTTKQLVGTAIKGAVLKGASALVGNNGALSLASKARGGNISTAILQGVASKAKNVGVKKFASNIWTRSICTATELAVRDFLTVGADLEAKNKGLHYLEDITDGEVKALSDSECWGRAAIVGGADLVISSLFRAQGSDGFTERIKALRGMDSSNIVNTTIANMKDAANVSLLNNYISHMRTMCFADSVLDVVENMSTMGIQAAMQNPYAKIGSGESWKTMWDSIRSPQSIALNLYATGMNFVTAGYNTSIYDDRMANLLKSVNMNTGKLGDSITKLDSYISKSNNPNAVEIHRTLVNVKTRADAMLKDKNLSPVEATLNTARQLDALFDESMPDENIKAAFDLTDSELSNIKSIVLEYNNGVSKEEDKIGPVTGMIFAQATKDNDEKVKAVYNELIKFTRDQAQSRLQKWSDIFHGSLLGKFTFLSYNSAKKSAELISKFYNGLVTDSTYKFSIKTQDVLDSFVANRFTTLNSLDTSDNKYNDFIQEQKEELTKYLSSDYFKTGVFNDDVFASETAITIEKDPKDPSKNIIVESNKGNRQNIIASLFTDAEANKDIIEKLKRFNIIKVVTNSNGKVEVKVNDGAPWFFLEVDASKRNDLLSARQANQALNTFFNCLDTVALMFEDETDDALVDYNIPLVLRLDIANGNKNNPDAKTTVYLLPNGQNVGIAEPINRLQAFQTILYDMYAFRRAAEMGKITDSSKYIKMLAELGTLFDESKTMDPFYNFLKEYNDNPNSEEIQNKMYLAISNLLSKSTFSVKDGKEPSNGFFNRKTLMNLYKCGALPSEMLQKIVDTQSSSKNGQSTTAATIAKEMLAYIQVVKEDGDISKIKANLKSFTSRSKNSETIVNQIKEFAKKIKENPDLRQSLEADDRLNDPVIKDLLNNTDGFLTNFWEGRLGLEGSSSDVLSRKLASLTPEDRQTKIKELITKYIGDEKAYHLHKDSLDIYKRIKDELTSKVFVTKDGKPNSRILSALKTNDDYVDFILNPLKFVDNLTAENITSSPLSEETVDDIIEETKDRLSSYLNANGQFNKSRLVMSTFVGDEYADSNALRQLVKDIKNGVDNSTTDMFKRAIDLVEGKQGAFNPDLLEVNSKGNAVIKYNGKTIGDYFLNENTAKVSMIIKSMLTQDKIDYMADLTSKVYSYYFEGDNVVRKPSKDIIEINVIDFLPKNLAEACRKFVLNDTAQGNYVAAGFTDPEELVKEFNKLMTGTSSGSTAIQYKTYNDLVQDCILTGNWIKQIDINNKESYARFLTLLIACGYDDQIYNNELISNASIPGVHIKNRETMNIDSDLSAEKILSIANKYRDEIKMVGGKTAPIDYIFVLKNLLGNYDPDENIRNLLYGNNFNYEIVKGKKTKVINDNINLYVDYIYDRKDISKPFDFINDYETGTIDRGIKGTLSGGAQADKFFFENRLTLVNPEGTNTQLDTRSFNTVFTKNIIDIAYDYFSDKHHQGTIEVTIPDKLIPQFEEMYTSKASLFEISKEQSTKNKYVLTPSKFVNDKSGFIKALCNEGTYDLRQILPVWDLEDTRIKKYDEPSEFQQLSLQSLYTALSKVDEINKLEKLYSLYIPGDDGLTHAYIRDIYDFSKDAEDSYKESLSGKTINDINVENLKQSNNYFEKVLANKIEIIRSQADEMSKRISQKYSSLFKFSNYKVLERLGEYLNKHDSILTKDYNVTDADINNIKTELQLDDSYDVKGLLDVLKTSEDSVLVRLSDYKGLPVHDDFISALTRFVDVNDGKLSISLDDLSDSTVEERTAFVSFLNRLISNPESYELNAEEVKSIKALINNIDVHTKLLDEIVMDNVSQANRPTRLINEVVTPNNPSMIVDPRQGMITENATLSQSLRKQIAQYVSNAEFARSSKKKTIKSSSLNINKNYNENVFKKALIKTLDGTVVINSDKVGSVLVANADIDGAIADSFASMISFSLATEDIITNKIGFNVKAEIADKFSDAINDLSIKARALTNGTDVDAEYAGALILKFNDVDGSYKITPLVTSASDETKSIISYFLGSGTNVFDESNNETFSFKHINESDEHEHYFMLKVNKNSFEVNSSGYKDGVVLLDIRNKDTQREIITKAINKAIWDRNEFMSFNPTNENIEKILFEHYCPQTVTTKDIWSNIRTTMRTVGIADKTIDTILPTITNLYVGQETSLTEQTIRNTMTEFGFYQLKDKVPNAQFKNFTDAITFGITRDALTEDDDIAFENAIIKLDIDDKLIYAIDNAIDNKQYDAIASLSKEDKIKAIKYYLLNKRDGGALQLILGARKQNLSSNIFDLITDNPTSLEESLSTWKHLDNDINVINATTKKTHVIYDTEWAYDDEDNEYPIYQLAFEIKSPLKDIQSNVTGQKFNIIVADGIRAKLNDVENVIKIEESMDSFNEKVNEIKNNPSMIITSKNLSSYAATKNGYIICDTEETAYKLFRMICENNGVEMVLGFNNKAENADDARASKYIGDWFADKENIDIRNDVNNKLYSPVNAKFMGQSMDYINRKLGTTINSAHDAFYDIDSEYDYYLKLINDVPDTYKLYTSNIEELKTIFSSGMTEEEFSELLSNIKFNELGKLSDSTEEIASNMFGKQIKSNESIKALLDSYNILNESISKRTNLKQLRETINNIKNAWTPESLKEYKAVVKNPIAKANVQKVFVKVMSSVLPNFSSLLDNVNSNRKSLSGAFEDTLRVMNRAVQSFKFDYMNSHNGELNRELALTSFSKFNQMFYTLPKEEIESYISKAMNRIVDSKTKTEYSNSDIALARTILKNFDQSEPNETTMKYLNENQRLYKILSDDSLNIVDVDKYDQEAIGSRLNLGFFKPLSKAFGLEENSTDYLPNSMSTELKKEIASSLMHVFGTTEENQNYIDQRTESTTIDNRRKTVLTFIDSYQEGMRDMFFGKDEGLFTKKLRSQLRLWTMGREKLVVNHSGEHGVIYIGKDLLGAKDAFAWTNLKYKVGDEFFTLVWRQPLQHQANIQMMKIKVVEGSGFAMSTDTSSNYFNGDFDGDSYFFTEPKPEYQQSGEEIWKLKQVPAGLFNTLFTDEANNQITIEKSLYDKYKDYAKAAMTNDAVYSALNNLIKNPEDYETYYDAFNKSFRTSFIELLKSDKRFSDLSHEDWSKLAKEYIENFGVKLVKTSKGILPVTFNSESIIDRTSPEFKKILENTKIYLNDNIYDAKIDAPDAGEAAKHFKNKLATSKDPSDIFFQSVFSMSQDNLDYLNRILSNDDNQRFINFAGMTDYINKLVSDGYVSQDIATIALNLINKKDANGHINSQNILYASQLLQQDCEINSTKYKETINKYVPDLLDKANAEDEQRVNALMSYMKQQGIDVPENIEKSGCGYMMAASLMYKNLLNKEQQTGYLKFTNNDNLAIQNIYNDIINNNRVSYTAKKDYEVITSASRVELRDKQDNSRGTIGLGSCRIAVEAEGQTNLEDSIYINDCGKNNLMFAKPSTIDFNKLSKSEQQRLVEYLRTSTALSNGEIDPVELNKAANLELDESSKYVMCGVVNRLGNIIEDLDEDNIENIIHSIVIIKQTSLYNQAKANQIKLGFTGAKAGKGTLIPMTEEFKEKGFGYVQLIMSSKLFDMNKTNINFRKDVVDTIVHDGKKYYIYDVYDLGLLNGTTIDAQSTAKEGYIDTIGIVQGGHNLDAAFSFGNLFISCSKDENGNITWRYDPQGYNSLVNSLSFDTVQRRIQDVNACHDLRALRIAFMLEAIKDTDLLTKTISGITNGKFTSAPEYINYLYKHGDLGGDYGDYQESIIYNVLRENDLLNNLKTLISKDNVLGRVVFSQEVNDALKNRYPTYYEEDSDQLIISKFQKPTKNVRVSNTKAVSKYQDFVSSLENSAHDLTNSYIPAISVLRMLVEESGGKFNKTMLKQAVDKGVLDLVTGKLGNLYNGFKFMKDGQYKNIDKQEEKISNIKNGMKVPWDMKLRNLENDQLYMLPSKSEVEDSLADDSMYGNWFDNFETDHKYDAANKFNVASHMMPFFTNGSDEEIFDSLNLWQKKFDFNINRKVVTLNKDNDQIISTVDTTVPEQAMSASEAKDFLLSNMRQPKQFELTEQKKQYFIQNFDNVTMHEALDTLDVDCRKFESTSLGQELLKIADKYRAELENDTYEYVKEENKISSLFNNLTPSKEDDVLSTISLCSTDNGIQLVNSWLKTWGFKAKGNKDISLGNQTIRMRQKVLNTKQDILGSEYNMIHLYCSKNKNLSVLLNKYMDAQKLVDAFVELQENEKTYIKKYGQEKYNELVSQVNDKISQTGFKSVSELQTYQTELLKGNNMLSNLVDWSSRLNLRLYKEAKKQDPYAIIGWACSMTEANKKAWAGHEYIKNQTVYKEKFLDGIEYEFAKQSPSKFASLLHNEDMGYLGSIEHIANQLATAKSIDSLSSFMRNTGYLQNFDVYNQAQKVLQDSINELFNGKGHEEIDTDRNFDINNHTFVSIKNILINCGITPEVNQFSDIKDIYNLYETIHIEEMNLLKGYGCSSSAELDQKLYEASQSGELENNFLLNQNISKHKAYESVLAVIVNMIKETKSGKQLLENIYKSIAVDGKVLVDYQGKKLEKKDESLVYNNWRMFDYFKDYMIQEGQTPEQRMEYIAQQALLGNVYHMNKSVADQLEKKVFSSRVNSRINAALKKAKALTTSMVMCTPVSLLDRIVNFPFFDAGVVGSADFGSFKNMPTSIATINKYMAVKNQLTPEMIEADPNLKLFIRFIATTDNDPLDDQTVRGESLGGQAIPLVRKYIKVANTLYNVGNLIPRFAYYLDLVKDAEANNFKLNNRKLGVTYHMSSEIDKIEANEFLVKSDVYNGNKEQADLDAKVAQIIAEHNGMEGNMPYAASWLNNNFNTMFLTFPMALLRWGKNRLQSLGYAFTDIGNSESRKYLLGQLGSMVASQAILLAIQLLLSQDTRNYLGKKAKGKDEEITEEEEKNAQNILFRGGMVKLFTTAMTGEETTTSAHSRGPVASLFDSYVADFIPAYNDGASFGKALKDQLLAHTWGHMNFIIKDPIESIPGNTFLQSTSWYQPDDNFFDNYGRKVLGYAMGSAQANSFMNYMQKAPEDISGLERFGNALGYAYSDKYTNTKENKSEYRNYKKAFTLVYDYFSSVLGDNQKVNPSETTVNLKADIKNALEFGKNSTDVYDVIYRYVEAGTSFADIKKALNSCLLTSRLTNLDYNSFMNTLSTDEKNVIKSALLYEEKHYPYVDDLVDYVNSKATQERAASDNYSRSISSILSTMNYNTPKMYNYSSKRKNYYGSSRYINFLNNYINNINYKRRYQNTESPLEAYNNSERTKNYGVSTDVWGTQTKHYANGATYTVNNQGYNPFGGNK